jgi:hypothetical protein
MMQHRSPMASQSSIFSGSVWSPDTVPRIPLAQALDEYRSWLKLDRHAAEGTVAEYRHDLTPFTSFAMDRRPCYRPGRLTARCCRRQTALLCAR